MLTNAVGKPIRYSDDPTGKDVRVSDLPDCITVMPTPAALSRLQYDPLKIHYCVVLGAENPDEVTPFQGFSRWWSNLHWALRLLVTQPADVLERAHTIGNVVAHRMAGTRSLFWFPFNIDALQQMKVEDLGVFFICFSPDPAVFAAGCLLGQTAILPFAARHPHAEVDGCNPDDFTDDCLRDYCRMAFEARADAFSKEQHEVASAALKGWTKPVVAPSGLLKQEHNVTLPNYMGN